MRRGVVFVLLLAGAPVLGAPAPFAKPPRTSGEPRWVIDVGPLSSAPTKGEYGFEFRIYTKTPNGGKCYTMLISVRDGKVYEAIFLERYGDGRVASAEGMPPGDSLKHILASNTRFTSTVIHGDNIELRRLDDAPIYEVAFRVHAGDVSEFQPTTRYAPRSR